MLRVALVIVKLLWLVVQAQCGDHIPARNCGVLFSEENFGGEALILEDFDQIASLKREYRHSLDGWQKTRSVLVDDGCTMSLCNDTYFQGRCRSLTSAESALTDQNVIVQSVNCTCKRRCTCEDVLIPVDQLEQGYVGRAYLRGGCSKCNSEYVRLEKAQAFPPNDSDSVRAFTIRAGCNLTIFPFKKFRGVAVLITQPVHQFKGSVGSYNYSCDGAPTTPHLNDTEPTEISISTDWKSILELVDKTPELSDHPAFLAAVTSANIWRNFRNVYLVIIGEFQPYWLGFTQCRNRPKDKIGECAISVHAEELSLYAKLSVITVPIGVGKSTDVDYQLMASLSKYLSTHDQLKDVIPNVVIVCHTLAAKAEAKEKYDSTFERKLYALHALRAQLLDERYSNVALLVELQEDVSLSVRRQPEETLNQFASEISKKWLLPQPVTFTAKVSNVKAHSHYVNGYYRMENGEYWPRALEATLERICKQGGDPLGEAIFRAVFLDNQTPQWSITPIVREVTVDKNRINEYRDMASKTPSRKDIVIREMRYLEFSGTFGTAEAQPLIRTQRSLQSHLSLETQKPAHKLSDKSFEKSPEKSSKKWSMLVPRLEEGEEEKDVASSVKRMKEERGELKVERIVALEKIEKLENAGQVTNNIWERLKLRWKELFGQVAVDLQKSS